MQTGAPWGDQGGFLSSGRFSGRFIRSKPGNHFPTPRKGFPHPPGNHFPTPGSNFPTCDGGFLGPFEADEVAGSGPVLAGADLAGDDALALKGRQSGANRPRRQAAFFGHGPLRRPRLAALVGVVRQDDGNQLFRGGDALERERAGHGLDAHPCPPMRFSWARMAWRMVVWSRFRYRPSCGIENRRDPSGLCMA